MITFGYILDGSVDKLSLSIQAAIRREICVKPPRSAAKKQNTAVKGYNSLQYKPSARLSKPELCGSKTE
jgi:hypothetical protein